MDTQEQAFSKALLDLIVPIVQAVVDPKPGTDIYQRSVSREMVNLISALKHFVSSVAIGGSPSSSLETRIEIELDDSNGFCLDGLSEHAALHDGAMNQAGFLPATQTARGILSNKCFGDLRDRIFNRMPIRLLCFSQHGSRLQITLLERSAVLTHLESKMGKVLATTHPTWDLSEIAVEEDKDKIEKLVSSHARYAILSHTWLRSESGEVTYGDWIDGRLNSTDEGYQKLTNFCKTVWETHGLTLGWMDTVCINKESSSELDESIRSMYKWYERAAVCIIYLAATHTVSEIYLDPWFTRGWTLQELLAPTVVKFYTNNWKQFVEDSENDKPSSPGYHTELKISSVEIMEQIEKATTMSKHELAHIDYTPLSRRMQLAAPRIVTREEDTAYSLMGIFDVSIAIAYGEGGQRAFARLLREIMNTAPSSSEVFDLFNWAGYNVSSISTILPASPQQYLARSPSINLSMGKIKPMVPLTLTHAGIGIPVLLMPAVSMHSSFKFDPIGDYTSIVELSSYNSRIPSTYCLLDRTVSGYDGGPRLDGKVHQYTFAVLNVESDGHYIGIPKTCIAIPIQCLEKAGKVTGIGRFERIYTTEPVIFNLLQRTKSASHDEFLFVEMGPYVRFAQDKLGKHGMHLLFKYL
ncbi:hypothetical protein BDN70DRAFT_930328 [Pholiota conissans]|uniref:Heterokaryon incompatibility domain-containing protein n=1 Tax=Pholiota conissans TaxID=109636 RepID=A0A9P5Z6L9_9AGAR|nr:hypothetical protein BDN70DRAFT_930328 [Pholiota conissans]